MSKKAIIRNEWLFNSIKCINHWVERDGGESFSFFLTTVFLKRNIYQSLILYIPIHTDIQIHTQLSLSRNIFLYFLYVNKFSYQRGFSSSGVDVKRKKYVVQRRGGRRCWMNGGDNLHSIRWIGVKVESGKRSRSIRTGTEGMLGMEKVVTAEEASTASELLSLSCTFTSMRTNQLTFSLCVYCGWCSSLVNKLNEFKIPEKAFPFPCLKNHAQVACNGI